MNETKEILCYPIWWFDEIVKENFIRSYSDKEEI